MCLRELVGCRQDQDVCGERAGGRLGRQCLPADRHEGVELALPSAALILDQYPLTGWPRLGGRILVVRALVGDALVRRREVIERCSDHRRADRVGLAAEDEHAGGVEHRAQVAPVVGVGVEAGRPVRVQPVEDVTRQDLGRPWCTFGRTTDQDGVELLRVRRPLVVPSVEQRLRKPGHGAYGDVQVLARHCARREGVAEAGERRTVPVDRRSRASITACLSGGPVQRMHKERASSLSRARRGDGAGPVVQIGDEPEPRRLQGAPKSKARADGLAQVGVRKAPGMAGVEVRDRRGSRRERPQRRRGFHRFVRPLIVHVDDTSRHHRQVPGCCPQLEDAALQHFRSVVAPSKALERVFRRRPLVLSRRRPRRECRRQTSHLGQGRCHRSSLDFRTPPSPAGRATTTASSREGPREAMVT